MTTQNTSNLSTVLRALMKSRRLSESELSRQTGIGQPVIHRMVSGETSNPKIETLRPVALYFNLSINQLIGDEPLPKGLVEGSYAQTVRAWVQVPLLNWEQAAQWPKVADEEITQHVPTDLSVSDNAFALVVKDSTMLPRFPEGTLIVIDPAYKPKDRDYAVVHIEGHKQATFKQILIDGEDTYLKPLNSDFSVTLLDKKYRDLGVMVQARIDYLPTQTHAVNSH
ncbi:MAG: helix-turn-helix domain-containing protein [Legionellales bacterium]|nr:helix-turn-helix domain-containing protein [Legionellales bacterium]